MTTTISALKTVEPSQALPQHIRTAHVDPLTGTTRVVTVYTGQIYVGHGAGDTRTAIGFEYPVLGLFPSASGGAVPGIVPLDDPRMSLESFEGAVAMVSFSDLVVKTDPTVFQIRDIAASLRFVSLRPATNIAAVVLSGVVEAEDSEVNALQYHVTVISRQTTPDPRRFTSPILVNSAVWDGHYALPLGAVIRAGVPQP